MREGLRAVSDELKVTLTLRRPLAERLRAMCHRRGLTASILVESWINEHDDNGRPVEKPAAPRRDAVDEFMDTIRKMGRR